MTSMVVAPNPIKKAQKNPRRAPSFMMVRLTGPTGIERIKPLIKPVSAASRIGGNSGMRAHSGVTVGAGFLVVLFLDVMAHLARDARPDETINQVEREKGRQHIKENDFVQDNNQAKDKRGNNGLGKS